MKNVSGCFNLKNYESDKFRACDRVFPLWPIKAQNLCDEDGEMQGTKVSWD
jgi:hypothetical protein